MSFFFKVLLVDRILIFLPGYVRSAFFYRVIAALLQVHQLSVTPVGNSIVDQRIYIDLCHDKILFLFCIVVIQQLFSRIREYIDRTESVNRECYGLFRHIARLVSNSRCQCIKVIVCFRMCEVIHLDALTICNICSGSGELFLIMFWLCTL